MLPITRRDFLAASTAVALAGPAQSDEQKTPPIDNLTPLAVPDWVWKTTRMCFASSGEVEKAVKSGAQVLHTNLVWPYFPLKRDGGGLSKDDDAKLKNLVATCHRHGLRLGLGLPPFPSVQLVIAHPDWRVHPDASGAILKVEPVENNLGTRLGCNLGPWGDYLIEVCGELVQDYGIDAFSFDGNYHVALCHCAACRVAYERDKSHPLPARINLDDLAYREYLVWRGDKLEAHYHKLQRRIKAVNPEAVIMTWTVNAGRYGHFLHSPRAMPTRLNRQFDAAMQEWWLDETNFGGSVAPAFGAAYLRTVLCGRPAASEPYLMSRGNPYGTDSFPAHERLTRTLLAVTNGCITAESLGWSGHAKSAEQSLGAVKEREPWLTRATPLPWCAVLVSEQTRQFYAYKDIAERFLPHVFGVFRAGLEEHLPLTLINDWDLNDAELRKYAVLVLPNAAALSDAQVATVRSFVKAGGGLVVTGETSLCDDLGRPRGDFALADVFGTHYQGRPAAPLERPELDPNFAVAIDENYWKQRTGVATLSWSEHPFFDDAKLQALVPSRSVRFRGPLVKVSEPAGSSKVIAALQPDGPKPQKLPAIVLNKHGQGQVIYLAAGLDAALWSYAYPYQRRLLVRLIESVARTPPPLRVDAPMCVQASAFTQQSDGGQRLVVHLFNGLNTSANHGLPSQDVPLREETVPIHGIKVRCVNGKYKRFRSQPGDRPVTVTRESAETLIDLPPLELHQMLVGEMEERRRDLLMSETVVHLRYTLSRSQRLIPQLRIWGLMLTALVVGLLSFFSLMALSGIFTFKLAGAIGFGFLALLVLCFFRGLLIGLLDVFFVPTRHMDIMLEENALGILLGKERWYLFLDGITRIDRFHPDVWTLQHFNGSVLHLAASSLGAEQLEHIRRKMEFGQTPEGVRAVIERGRRIREMEEGPHSSSS